MFTTTKHAWNSDQLGNHRILVYFNGKGKIAKTIVNWRRSDLNPTQKGIIIQDSISGNPINNFWIVQQNREQATICFEPTQGAGNYYIYYLPYKNEGRSNYPKGVYLKPTLNTKWIDENEAQSLIPNAKALEIQAIDKFNSFYPMEVIASAEEVKQLVSKQKNISYLVFPEDRAFPIAMKKDIPQRWVKSGPQKEFKGTAKKGENYSFQLGVFAQQDLQNIRVKFSDLKDQLGNKIAANLFSCLNTDGITYDAKPFHANVNVNANEVQALWCLLNLPTTVKPGKYRGTVQVSSAGTTPQSIALEITVSNLNAVKNGVNEPWKQTRLTWLNSTLAQKNTVVAPYTALQVDKNSISLLGRKVTLGEDGFPSQIQTFFSPEMTDLQTSPNNILAEGIHFHFVGQADGKNIQLKNNGINFTKKEEGTVQWTAQSNNEQLRVETNGNLEFDGFMAYTVKVTALTDLDLKDITLHIPFAPKGASYMMGLGQKGGFRPTVFNWKWDVANKNQDGAWLGNVNAGLQFSLRDENYLRPLNTNFYLQKPLLLPKSWGNDGKGGIDIGIKGSSMLVNNYSGERKLKKGEVLYYNFNLLITPFHTIKTDFQWENRFYHKYDNIATIQKEGATLINIHHATPINPWINYPFIEWQKMKNYIDSAHQAGLKVKIYNTVRELSNRAYETFPLRSLGHEVYSPGKGGGFSWLQEHLNDDYIAAWFVPKIKDAAVVNSGMSRWHNYYVEGMNWLTQNVGIDGIYLDDVAFDRITMKRIKRVLTKDGHPGIIDLHSANQYNKSDGFNNSANLYMEHFPYLNRLWFGEYFDYENNSPDFFLTEVSGIPFGLMGEMLQDGGNRWRGMIYGMTNRWPWEGAASNPNIIWNLWDDFGMKGSKMIGYWSPNCPVSTNNSEVLTTVYKKPGAAMIAVASWAKEDTKVNLNIDWQKLGIDPSKVKITIPAIPGYQEAQIVSENKELLVPKGKGFIVLIK
jgi:hypothetical protein